MDLAVNSWASIISIPCDYFSFAVSFEIENWNLPVFFCFKIDLAILSPFRSRMNFMICLSIVGGKKKVSWDFDTNLIKSVDQFGSSCHVNNIKSSDL